MMRYVNRACIEYTTPKNNTSLFLNGIIWLNNIVYKGEVMSIRSLFDIKLLLIGLLLFLGGIYVSQWSNLAIIVGIGGGIIMGLSATKQLFKN